MSDTTSSATHAPVMIHDDERRSLSTRIAYLAVGGAVGAAVALLFAPKAGRELRTDLADATRKSVDLTRDAAANIGARAGEYYEISRERAAETLAAGLHVLTAPPPKQPGTAYGDDDMFIG